MDAQERKLSSDLPALPLNATAMATSLVGPRLRVTRPVQVDLLVPVDLQVEAMGRIILETGKGSISNQITRLTNLIILIISQALLPLLVVEILARSTTPGHLTRPCVTRRTSA